MALWICAGCTCAYSVGAVRCPQCGSREHTEEGAEDMAKITVHGGPSNELADEQGGEGVSAGTSSSTSSETPQPSTGQSEKQAPSRARSTGSRSGRNREEGDSSAPRTATGGRKTAGDHSDGK